MPDDRPHAKVGNSEARVRFVFVVAILETADIKFELENITAPSIGTGKGSLSSFRHRRFASEI